MNRERHHSDRGTPAATRPIRVLRVIARMNMGGPAHHVSILSGRLRPLGFETLLVAGGVGPGEASAAGLAGRHGARLRHLESLGPEVRPISDLKSVAALVRIARNYRPDVIHTHTAKAGMVGRVAALFVRPRPIVVHTYHGHVLEGYFGPLRTTVYRSIERMLGLVSDALVGVSQATVDDLVRLRIARRPKFRVIPVGLDLTDFLKLRPEDGHDLRRMLRVTPDEILVTYVGRLAPIKRIDVMLRAFARAQAERPSLHLAIVGDGSERDSAEELARSLGVSDAIHFLGYRTDLPAINAASDMALLASANEGTPVALIEAAAAGRPAVATAVGGVADVVTPETGILVAAEDEPGLAAAIAEVAGDREQRLEMGARARDHVRRRFSAERLLSDAAELYRDLLRQR